MINPKYTDFVSFLLTRRNLFNSPIVGFYLKIFAGVSIGKKSKFYGWPIVFCRDGGIIKIGHNFIATSKSVSNTVGIPHPVILSAIGNGVKLKIGNNVGISGASINCRSYIEIGDNVMIGGGVAIWDTDFHPVDPIMRIKNPKGGDTKPIIIKNNVFIGARAIILKGVTIGENSVIGAASVINKSVPANSLAYGNPMRIKPLNNPIAGKE